MARRIDFEAKTDRELLLLTANATNEMSGQLKTLNGTVRNHESRITVIETESKALNPVNNPTMMTRLINKGKVPGLIVGMAGLMFTSIYSLGQISGWWA